VLASRASNITAAATKTNALLWRLSISIRCRCCSRQRSTWLGDLLCGWVCSVRSPHFPSSILVCPQNLLFRLSNYLPKRTTYMSSVPTLSSGLAVCGYCASQLVRPLLSRAPRVLLCCCLSVCRHTHAHTVFTYSHTRLPVHEHSEHLLLGK
jgi:hypothetical protein